MDLITYITTWQGWAYLATVIDYYSRRVVGFAIAQQMRADLIIDALRMAITHRNPPSGVIFHSDRGGNTPHTSSVGSAATMACAHRSDAPESATTTPSLNRSSRP
jgi:transposase InsO family protein